MALHLIKLFVGIDTVPELAAWQAQCLADRRQADERPELLHVTRSMPKRRDEIIPGGSLYWVMKGWIVARQRLLDLRRVDKGDAAHCALVFDQELVTVEPHARRPFQGWRYLEEKDAPRDRGKWTHDADIPLDLRRDLAALGLL
jgi:hypothetical protein